MPTAYAEVLEASWTAVPYSDAAIAVYPTSPVDGGFVGRSPTPIPASNPVADAAWDAATYVDGAGNRRWVPTAAEDDLIRRVTANPYDGLDELVESSARSVGRSAGSSLDDVVGQLGGRASIGAGAAIGGAIAGYSEYASGGGLASAVAVGVGAGIGGAAGTVIGGAIGTVAGPVGVAIGGAIGGVIGSAIGAAIGDAIIPDANKNGAQAIGDPPFEGGQCAVGYNVFFSGITTLTNGQTTNYSNALATSVQGPISAAYFYLVGNQLRFVSQSAGGTVDNSFQFNVQSHSLSISVARQDGQIDNCGNPGGAPALYDPNTNPNRPAFRDPSIDLPGGPLPRRRPRGRGRGFDPDGYRPTGEPVPGVDDDGNPIDPSLPDGYPADPGPYPDPTGDDGTDGGAGDGDGDGQCDPCAKLDEILDLLKAPFSGEVILEPCEDEEDGETMTYEFEDQGIAGLHYQLKSMTLALEDIWDRVKCESDETITIPEHWPLRRGAERPQLIVVYRTKERDGSWGNTRYQFSIPWFDHRKRKTLKTSLPRTIRKGAKQASLLLTDNSKMTLFCSTHAEGERVLKSFELLVVPRFRTRDIRFSDLNGNGKREYQRVTVHPFVAKYYPAGMRNLSPSWRDKLY